VIDMPVSRAIAFYMVALSVANLIAVSALPFFDVVTEKVLSVRDTLIMLEKLEINSVTVERWRVFLRQRVGGITYRYAYVERISLEITNLADVSYPIQGLRLHDLFLVFSLNEGTDRNPQIKTGVIRIRYSPSCSSSEAPCWRVLNIKALKNPSDDFVAEGVNPFEPNTVSGKWDGFEIMNVVVELPRSLRFVLVQITQGINVVGGLGWIYFTLCTPYGACSKPLNLLNKPWQAKEEIEE